jgi:hypothetical protein
MFKTVAQSKKDVDALREIEKNKQQVRDVFRQLPNST